MLSNIEIGFTNVLDIKKVFDILQDDIVYNYYFIDFHLHTY